MPDIRICQVQDANHRALAAQRDAEHRTAGVLRFLRDVFKMPRVVPRVRDEEALILFRGPAGQPLPRFQAHVHDLFAPRPFGMHADQFVRRGIEQPQRHGKGVEQVFHLV